MIVGVRETRRGQADAVWSAGAAAAAPAVRARAVVVRDHRGRQLDRLRPAWDALYAADPAATPFLAPGWAQAWLDHWSSGVRPWVLTVHDADELIGLAALGLTRRGPLRAVVALGSYVGNHWDVLARPERRDEVASAVAGVLTRRSADWDVLTLDTLPEGSELAAALVRAGLRVRRRGARPYPHILLPSRFEDYLGLLPRSHRSNLRRHLRPLDRGELALVAVTERAELDAAVAAWQDVRQRWWRERGKDLNPDHARPAFGAFLQAMVKELVPLGRAEVLELRRGGERLGVSINLCDDRAYYWWLSGFEPAAAGIGPGKVVIGETIRASIDAGRDVYDFMVGAEPYKYWFGGADRHVPRLVVASGRPRSMVAAGAARVLEQVRSSR